MDDEERAETLHQAAELIAHAHDLVREAVRGTDMEHLTKNGILSALDHWARDTGEPTSLVNLSKNLSLRSQDPLWTQPLGSPKYPDRRAAGATLIKHKWNSRSGAKMRLWGFGRLKGSKVRIPAAVGGPLGMVNGSQVFSRMFRYDQGGHRSYEIALSSFGPESYRRLYSITFHMRDEASACAQVSRFLAERDIDILNSDSLSVISSVGMVWRMLADISYFGEADELEEAFRSLKGTSSLSKVEEMVLCESNICERFNLGAAPSVTGISTKLIKTDSEPTVIEDGEFRIPTEYLEMLKDVDDGSVAMMVADTDSAVLSLTFLKDAHLAELSLIIPDRPGAVQKVTEALSELEMNLLAVHTKVLVFYERMSLDLVIDLGEYPHGIDVLSQKLCSGLGDGFELAGLRRIDP